MKLRKKLVIVGCLLIISIIIHLYSRSKMRVETGYSTHFFSQFSRFLRSFFGFFPFSIGDLVYGFLFLWLIWRMIKFIRNFKSYRPGISRRNFYTNFLLNFVTFWSCMYIIFNIFWGINYNRKGIAWQLDLEMQEYSRDDLKNINSILVEKINTSKLQWVESNNKYPTNKELYSMVNKSYQKISKQYPFLEYQPSSIKTSMWGWLGNYTGFTGYYNPFTAEAQLNTSVPEFLHPFITCHEVAHQIGYAKEMEANFVGYLAASNSDYPLFHYSVYLEMFIYANRNLYFTDSLTAKKYRKELNAFVLSDFKEWSKFEKDHRSFVEPVISWVYGKFLQGNEQPAGVLSYDKVTAFIIAYYKKFGSI